MNFSRRALRSLRWRAPGQLGWIKGSLSAALHVVAVWAALLWVTGATSLLAQVVPATPTCTACRIRVTPVVSLGDSAGAGILERQPRVVLRDGRGRYFVFSGQIPTVYQSSGRVIGPLTRAGRGPGELAAPWGAAVGLGDTVTVFDITGSALVSFGPDLRYSRRTPVIPTGNFFELAALPGGRTIANGHIGGPANRGQALHLIESDGRIARSFGRTVLPGTGQPGSRSDERRVAVGDDGTIWAAHVTGLTFQQFDANGTLIRTLSVRPRWFPQWERDWTPQPETPPPPFLWRVRVDSAGLIWAYVHVPSPAWQSAVTSVPNRPGVWRFDGSRGLHTMVVVLDPRAARVVLEQRLAMYVVDAMDRGYVAAYYEDAGGLPRVAIHHLTLIR